MTDKAIQREVFDKDGNLVRIEAVQEDTGEHILDILWDPNDEQTEKKRQEFRMWASNVIRRKNFIPIN